jgi:eRF1 domain 2
VLAFLPRHHAKAVLWQRQLIPVARWPLQVLGKFSVELPKKHGRGGQSALRFARLRMEKRHNYVRKVGDAPIEWPPKQAVCWKAAFLAPPAAFRAQAPLDHGSC